MKETKNFSVLIAEDNEFNASFLRAALIGLDINSDIAYDGLEVLELIKKKKYNLIFMDCQMPNMDGYEATRKIRGMQGYYKEIPIIATSATLSMKNKEDCIDVGMNDVVLKPVDIGVLEFLLNKYIRNVDKGFWEKEDANPQKSLSYQGCVEILSKEMRFTYDEAEELMKNFIACASQIITKIELAYLKRRNSEVKMYAHQIKGMACSMRIYKIQSKATEIECCGDNVSEDIHELKRLLEELKNK